MIRSVMTFAFLILATSPLFADLKNEKLLKSHDPIAITNDEGFEDLAAQPGSGVTGGPGEDEKHPYVIENLKIAHDDKPAISITGTTAYFMIRNVATEGVVRRGLPSTAPGLKLDYVENGTISDCRFANDSGINLHMSYKNAFDRCDVKMGTILLYDTNRCTFTDCKVLDSVAQGFMIWHGKKDVFRRCMAIRIQREGIAFNGSAMDCEITDCVFDRCVWAGISLEGSPRFAIRGNKVSESRGYGIVLAYGSDDLTVEDNTVTYSGQDGIQLQTCKRAMLRGNTIRNGGSTGIFFLGSEDSSAVNNTIEQANTGISVTGGKSKNVFEGNDISHCMHGIELDGSDNSVRNNKIYASRNAINLKASSTVVEGNRISDMINGVGITGAKNTVRKNTFEWMGIPIILSDAKENDISDNTIKGFVFGGIYLYPNSSKNRITGNTIEGGRTSSGAIVLEGATGNQIENNTLTENPTSLNLSKGSDSNAITANQIIGAGTGIAIVDSKGNTVTGNRLDGCSTPFSIIPKWMEQNKVENNEVKEK